MTNPVTPNIGLNKIDRTSPSTTYFDLEKYIDQNADAVDRFAGETNESINALGKRLDTEERREVVLQPGLQIVNAERSAPFKLSGIKGRTLVNLLGRVGSCDSLSGISPYNTLIEIVNNQSQGTAALKVTVAQGFPSGAAFFPNVKFSANKKYVLIVEAQVANAEYARIHLPSAGAIGNNVTSATFKPSIALFSPTSDVVSNVDLALKGTSGSVGYFDAARIYEITDAEYATLSSMTPEQVASKYPYVDSVQPVRNPYAIRYGENLLPPFYKWASRQPYHTEELYKVFSKAAPAQVIYVDIPVCPGILYTLLFESLKCDYVAVHDNSGANASSMSYLVKVDRNPADDSPYIVQFNGPKSGVVRIHLYAYDLQAEIDGVDRNSLPAYDIHATNPILTIGLTPKPFKPREDSMLALQTDLYADPVSGADADEVFEKDGQYFRLAKWVKATLTDKFNFVGIGGKGAGWKQTFFDLPSNTSGPYSETVIKYDGKKLQSNQITSSPDISAIDSGNAKRCYISIANTDSGWGDNYSPTADEIKAYFMGWMMYDGSGSNATPDYPVNNFYNGTGVKAWAYRADGVTRTWLGWTDKLPTTQAPNWTPYQLLYRLANESIEPIVSEGMLTFNEGDNQIEVGTGIVLREKATPVLNGPHYNVNNTNYPLSLLDNKTERIIRFYKNNADDPWSKFTNLAYGNEGLYTLAANFDPSATYSVTYLMLDKSPIVPFTGSYASNEKAMIEELNEAVQQNATSVSVLMNKKVEKNVSVVQIKPTLLNGWVEYLSGYHHVRYYKDSSGIVHLTGLVKTGAINSEMFKLAEGYRPVATIVFAQQASTGSTARLDIFPGGGVYFNYAASWNADSWVSLDGISFLAEQ
ncbi:hypothetical protein M1D70_26310 [Paenibacillus sp. AK002]